MMLATAKRPGIIALTTVIVLGALLLMAGLTLTYTNLDFVIASSNYSKNSQAELNAKTCFEEGQNKLVSNVNYSGQFTITLPSGSCTATVSVNANPSYRDIAVTGDFAAQFFFAHSYTVDVTQNPFVVVID